MAKSKHFISELSGLMSLAMGVSYEITNMINDNVSPQQVLRTTISYMPNSEPLRVAVMYEKTVNPTSIWNRNFGYYIERKDPNTPTLCYNRFTDNYYVISLRDFTAEIKSIAMSFRDSHVENTDANIRDLLIDTMTSQYKQIEKRLKKDKYTHITSNLSYIEKGMTDILTVNATKEVTGIDGSENIYIQSEQIKIEPTVPF